jgi:hypothetical protein
VQSQNGNLSTEFQNLQQDVHDLDWANEYFGSLLGVHKANSGEPPDASNVWIGNDESVTSIHLGSFPLGLY